MSNEEHHLSTTPLRLGFVGTGNMGLPMATNLQRYLRTIPNKPPPLLVYARTPTKVSSLQDKTIGARIVSGGSEGLAELAHSCDLIFLCLTDDAAVRSVCESILAASVGEDGHWVGPQILVDCSTVAPETTQAMVTSLAETSHGVAHFVACPVFGPPSLAQNAQLVAALGGPPAAVEVVKSYIVPAICRAALEVGPNQEVVSRLKLVGNFFVFGIGEMLAEGTTLATASGISQDTMLEFIRHMYPHPVFIDYSERQTKDLFTGERIGFRVNQAQKDVRHIKALATESKVKMPLLEILDTHLEDLEQRGHASDWDWSSIVTTLRRQAGMAEFLRSDETSALPARHSKE